MLKTVVRKFPIELQDGFVDMPKGARVVRVGEQDDVLFIWLAFQPPATFEKRRIVVLVSSTPVDGLEYLGCYRRGASSYRSTLCVYRYPNE